MNLIKRLRISTQRGIIFLFTLALLPMLLAISPVWSSNVQNQKPAIVSAQQVIDDDLYLAGDTVTIDGTVKGDAVLAGREITVNGTVEGDLIAAGQVVTINGTVGDDIRMAGQVLTLGTKARVGDDAIAAGLSLENKAGSTVGGSINFLGAQALLAGTVKQNVGGTMNSLDLRGSVGKNVQVIAIGDRDPLNAPLIPKPAVEIPKVQPGLSLSDAARVSGKLTYQSINTANISQKAQITGGVVRQALQRDEAAPSPSTGVAPLRANPAWIIIHQLQRLGALLLIGWLLLRFVPGWTQTLAATVQTKPLPSLAWGIISCIGVAVIAIAIAIVASLLIFLLAFTLPNLILPVIGIGTLANLTLLIGFALFANYVPQIVMSFLGGRWLLQTMQPNVSSGSLVSLVVGLVLFVILTAIPILGGILNLAIVLVGLGAVWIWAQTKRDRVQYQQLTTV